MAEIQVLPEEVINKIAAGEVIERPASVVKEVVENALDAGANKISIELERAGMDSIIIQDNGKGMSKEDARLSIQRHATSKINKADDLFDISTLGFRGEALASIAAISKFSLQTKRNEDIEGTKLETDGGKGIASTSVGCPKGTRIEVRDIFFNVPVRQKYLKTENTELHAIIDIISRYALISPQAAFKVMHKGREVFSTTGNGSTKDAILGILGLEIARNMLEVEYEKEGISIKGFISKPTTNRSDRSDQSTFVNGRFVRNPFVNTAIDKAYHTLMMVGRHPVVVLDIRIDPQRIDVNVHPTKLHIRIEEEEKVQNAIEEAIRMSLEKNDLVGDVPESFTPRFDAPRTRSMGRYKVETDTQTVLESAKPIKEYRSAGHISKSGYGKVLLQKPTTQQVEKETRLELPRFRILGQVQKTFFLAEVEDGIYIVDQHVAHERVLYEEFLNLAKEKKMVTQELLEPKRLDLNAKDAVLLKEHLDMFTELGFEIEELQGDLIVRKVPVILNKEQSVEVIKDMLDGIVNKATPHDHGVFDEVIDSVVARMACRTAVKAGEELNSAQINRILGQLLNTDNPFSCPHGRPIIVRMTSFDLEKMFKRH